MLYSFFSVFAFICVISVCSGLECFRCVYDQRKPQGALVWNNVRRVNETNDAACFRPDRYNVPQHLEQSMQRCSSRGHCNKQMFYYRYYNDFYIARGCDDVCYNDLWENIDLRRHGYDYVDIQYSCCDDDRCNGAMRTITLSSVLVATVLLALNTAY